MKKLTLMLLPILLLWLALSGFGIYGLLLKKKHLVMRQEGLQEWQDERIHQSLSREVMLELTQTTGNAWLAETLTLTLGYTKEMMDVVQGKPFSERDIEANMQGCAEAREILGIIDPI